MKTKRVVARVLPDGPKLALVITTPGLLTIRQAAEYLNVPFETFKWWAYREHRFPIVKLTGRRTARGVNRWRIRDLDAYVERSVIPAFDPRAIRRA